MFMSVPQRELIDEDRTEPKSAGVGHSLGRYLAVGVEDALELLVQVLDRSRAQFMKDSPNANSSISVWIRPTARRHYVSTSLSTRRADGLIVVVLIAQHVADFRRQFGQQCQGLLVIGHVRW